MTRPDRPGRTDRTGDRPTQARPTSGAGRGDEDRATERDGASLRLDRLAHGLSQQDLAAGAGVTRQAVAGLETGQWDPSLRVALGLARTLGTTVEELFGPASQLPAIDAVSLAPLPGGPGRVEIGRVGSAAVALPLAGANGMRPGFVPSDGVAVTVGADPTSCRVRPVVPPRPALVVAGCDPALPLLRGPLERLDHPVGLQWWPCSSEEALRLAAAGAVHVAGFHRDRRTEVDSRLAATDGEGPCEVEVLQFASWSEGLAVGPALGPPVAGLADVARSRLRLANREPGSQARNLLDAERLRLGIAAEEIVGYASSVQGHLLVASAVAAGVADVGVTIEPAALACGLGFVPLAEERSLLAIPRRLLATPEVQALLRVLASTSVRDQLSNLPGYCDVERCGAPIHAA